MRRRCFRFLSLSLFFYLPLPPLFPPLLPVSLYSLVDMGKELRRQRDCENLAIKSRERRLIPPSLARPPSWKLRTREVRRTLSALVRVCHVTRERTRAICSKRASRNRGESNYGSSPSESNPVFTPAKMKSRYNRARNASFVCKTKKKEVGGKTSDPRRIARYSRGASRYSFDLHVLNYTRSNRVIESINKNDQRQTQSNTVELDQNDQCQIYFRNKE